MNEETSKMIAEAHAKITYASDCLNAWRGKFDSMFGGVVNDTQNIKPLFPEMNDMELQFQAAYEWMESNYDVLASNIRIVADLVDESDELLCQIEMQ